MGVVLQFELSRRRRIQTMQLKRSAKIEKGSSVDLMLNSVVKVYFASREFSKLLPWQTLKEEEWTGSGFVIWGKKLTNAHVVEVLNKHTLVYVKKRGSEVQYEARVQKISHECDLANLEIDSDKFWDGMNPLEFGDIPPRNEKVFIAGYRRGSKIWVTKGRVSQVKTREYVHSATELLAIQIDGPVYRGNSGGPVIMGNKVVGVAFQGTGSRNKGSAIPTPIIMRFLNGVEESSQKAIFTSLGLSYQSMKNAQLRKHFEMSPDMTGILINKINLSSGAYRILKRNDIILAIDGVQIGNDETGFNHLVSMKKQGETASIKVLRKGKEHVYNICLKPAKPHSKVREYYNLPSYYIFGGFFFVHLTMPYIYERTRTYYAFRKAGQEAIVISKVLSDVINKGYESFEYVQVERVNGVKVKNLKHLCKLIEECCTEDVRLDLEDDKVIVLNYESAKKATSRILKRHGIKSAISKDLRLPPQPVGPCKDTNGTDLLPWSVLRQLLDWGKHAALSVLSRI